MKHKLYPSKCELFHGNEKTRPYFEGWYFKHALPSEELSLSVICGVSRGKDAESDHSFIQIITGPNHRSYYIKYDYSEFSAKEDEFNVRIGENTFSINTIHLDISSPEIQIKADLCYSNHVLLENSVLSPSIMGIFAYMPNMECNHGVLSMKHDIKGSLTINGREYSLIGSIGYIEKDWGESFPNAWIWLQGNTAKEGEDISFMCSVASIPMKAFNFTGLICAIDYKGEHFRFATYNSSKILGIKNKDNGVDIVIGKRKYRLTIKAHAEEFEKLVAPTRNGMERTLYESVSGKINIKLYFEDEIVFDSNLSMCGIEISEIGLLEK